MSFFNEGIPANQTATETLSLRENALLKLKNWQDWFTMLSNQRDNGHTVEEIPHDSFTETGENLNGQWTNMELPSASPLASSYPLSTNMHTHSMSMHSHAIHERDMDRYYNYVNPPVQPHSWDIQEVNDEYRNRIMGIPVQPDESRPHSPHDHSRGFVVPEWIGVSGTSGTVTGIGDTTYSGWGRNTSGSLGSSTSSAEPWTSAIKSHYDKQSIKCCVCNRAVQNKHELFCEKCYKRYANDQEEMKKNITKLCKDSLTSTHNYIEATKYLNDDASKIVNSYVDDTKKYLSLIGFLLQMRELISDYSVDVTTEYVKMIYTIDDTTITELHKLHSDIIPTKMFKLD